MLYLYIDFLVEIYRIDPRSLLLLIFALFGVSVFGLVMMYLQTGLRFNSRKQSVQETSQSELEKVLSELESLRSIPSRLSNIEDRVEVMQSPQFEISDNQYAEFVEQIRKSIEKSASAEFVQEIETSLNENKERLDLHQVSRMQYETIITRLKEELQKLSLRGNVNLAIGVATALIGILILYSFVEGGTWLAMPGESKQFVEGFIPRLSIVILVEALAYFFLRLYRAS